MTASILDGDPQAILDALPTGIACIAPDQTFRFANAAYRARFGACVGRHVADVLGPALYERIRAQLERTFDGAPEAFDLRVDDGDDARWYHAEYTPALAADGSVRAIVTEVRDVTSARRAELDMTQLIETQRLTNERLTEAIARAQDADRKKDEFLAMLGHELRNPLAPIVTALDLMTIAGGAEFAREREVIRRQATHLTRLVDDLLDLSRITREKIQLCKEPLEVASVIQHAIEVVSPLLEQRRHQLVVDVPRTGFLLDADPVRLSQVFSNLLANAAKYTEPGGRIVIAAERDDDEIAISVIDNGIGISQGLLDHVFEPFVQSDRTIDRAQGGLGLGLALVRSLTQLHGGTATVSSDGPGRGSRFVIRLPAFTGMSEVTEDVTAKIVVMKQASGRVLVVDDNPDAADTLAAVLRGVGYEVAVAHDAPAALQIAVTFQPAIALLDIGLPVMDGYELARHLRESLADPPRLVAVSGYGQDADLARSRAAGFDVHLGKPVSYETLVDVLGSLPVSAAPP